MKNETIEKMSPESAPVLEPGGVPQTPNEFLSKEELALRLKRTVRTIEVWQKRGILPYVKCENTVLFNWAEVVAHLQKNYRVCRQRRLGEPMRLPVYQMAAEEKARTKCRGRARLRGEAAARQGCAPTRKEEMESQISNLRSQKEKKEGFEMV